MITEQQKRIILLIIFLASIGFIGFLIYFVFFKKPITPPIQKPIQEKKQEISKILPESEKLIKKQVEEQKAPEQIGLPITPEITPPEQAIQPEEKKPEILVEKPILKDITILQNQNQLVFYDKNDGKFYKIDENGIKQPLSDKIFFNVKKVNWDTSGSQAIIEYPDNSKIYYNFQTGKQYTLPKNWQEFSFNTTGNQIAFKEITDNPELNWLSVANPDGSNKQSIEHLGIYGDKVQVTYSPNQQIIGISRESSGQNQTTLYFLTKNGQDLKAARVKGFDIQAKWTKDGNNLIYSSISMNDLRPHLWMIEANGDRIGLNMTDLKLQTWIDKCNVVDSTTVFCAVPQQLPVGAGIERDIADKTPDDIYKVDLKTGSISKIAETDKTIDKLIVNKDKSTIFFIDKQNNNLYTLKLK